MWYTVNMRRPLLLAALAAMVLTLPLASCLSAPSSLTDAREGPSDSRQDLLPSVLHQSLTAAILKVSTGGFYGSGFCVWRGADGKAAIMTAAHVLWPLKAGYASYATVAQYATPKKDHVYITAEIGYYNDVKDVGLLWVTDKTANLVILPMVGVMAYRALEEGIELWSAGHPGAGVRPAMAYTRGVPDGLRTWHKGVGPGRAVC